MAKRLDSQEFLQKANEALASSDEKTTTTETSSKTNKRNPKRKPEELDKRKFMVALSSEEFEQLQLAANAKCVGNKTRYVKELIKNDIEEHGNMYKEYLKLQEKMKTL